MDAYRVDDIRRATVNGRKCKSFCLWRKIPDSTGYVFVGVFTAPPRTARAKLADIGARTCVDSN